LRECRCFVVVSDCRREDWFNDPFTIRAGTFDAALQQSCAAISPATLDDGESFPVELGLFPIERSAVLVLDDAGLEEVLLLLEIHRLRHPRKRIFRIVRRQF
jgi:hypothetical protein